MTTTAVHVATCADLVARARAAQQTWAGTPIRQRLRLVRALRHLIVTECDSLCAAVARDIGKPSEETLGGDLLAWADACRFLERRATSLLRPKRVPMSQRPLWMWGQADTVHRRPRGVVGIIGTWNYPLFLNGVQIVQALTAGNAVVWKPSEVAPSSAAALCSLLQRAGFSNGLVQMLEPTRENGPLLLEADIDHLVFTGAVATGRRIAARLGERLISSTLELSGCDAQLVLDDADVTLAARAAWFGATLNRGQTCIAPRRAFVDRSVYPAFCEELGKLTSTGTPVRLALGSQVRQAERLVQEALAEGGRLLGEDDQVASDQHKTLGGRDTLVPPIQEEGETRVSRPPSPLVTPRVVLDARPEMALCHEASFAPVLAVLPCDGIEDTLRMEARCPFALGASIFTRSPRRAEALASRLRAGMVTVNDVIVPTAHPATPFGGRGDSGWGVTQGAEGLLEMTVPQVVSVRTDRFRPHYGLAEGKGVAQQGELFRGLLESGHATTLGQRLRGWRRLLRALWNARTGGTPVPPKGA
jgi:acyl-CoA reductase-like NAD-dependent aldehyde dehydrogenase